MDYLNNNIALNLKRIRLSKEMSLDVVAEQTGVSKSMLGQIERGEANPTIGTLGKIVSGLRVEFKELVSEPKQEAYMLTKQQMVPSKEVLGKYVVYTFFPFEKHMPFELYVIDICPGASYYSGSHGENTKEYLYVARGSLRMEIDSRVYIIEEQSAFRFLSDREHIYTNIGEEELELVSVFSFGR